MRDVRLMTETVTVMDRGTNQYKTPEWRLEGRVACTQGEASAIG